MADDKKTTKAPEEAAKYPEEKRVSPERDGKRIDVRGPECGRWRGGYYFTSEPQTIAASDLSEEQLQAIESDPHLAVRFY